MAPTLFASRNALPPEGAVLAWGGPALRPAPTLFASRNALPPEGAVLAWGGPALRTVARLRKLALLSMLAFSSISAHAESVALAGMLGSKALLVVDGSPPKSVAAGETHQGVKVISTSGDQAVIEQSGKRVTLRVGEAPVSMGASSGGSGRGTRIVLTAGTGGHFMTPGQINGKAVQFMVDTGATSIAMSGADAARAGINFKNGQPVNMSTANGVTQGFRVKLNSVRIGDVEVFDVDAVVTPQAMPFMLLGNSFLTRFQMTRENDQMTLIKRY